MMKTKAVVLNGNPEGCPKSGATPGRGLILRKKTCLAALAACGVFFVSGVEAADAKLRFGVCSDLHLGEWNKGRYLERACAWWKREKIDAIIIAGDLADCGDMKSVGYVRDTLQKVFNDAWPEILICWGNHDGGSKPGRLTKENKSLVLRDWFRMGETTYPTYLKNIKGYVFVGSHFRGWKGEQDLDAFLTAHADELKGTQPFFYFQHQHPRGTCHGKWVWGQDDGKTTAALAKYPNAIAFSGHSHQSLTDEHAIWQGAFTSVGTASMSSVSLPDGRENGIRTWPESRMPGISVGWGHQAMMVTVFADRIVLERREFHFSPEGDVLGEPWVIPLDETRPFTFETRRTNEKAPAFAADAKLVVTRRRGLVRDKMLPEEDQWHLAFPTAQPRDGLPRAFDYEVAAVCDVDDIERRIVKRVYSKWCFLEPERDPEAECVFGVRELPLPGDAACTCEKFRGTVRFEVRPVGPFGTLGQALVSETFPRK